MRITLDIHLVVNGTKTLKSGQFNLKYNEDIPTFAYKWISATRKETGYYGNQSIIEKVIVNGSENITSKVLEIENRPIPDLDFLW